jgi:hypothetical protein
LGLFTQGPEESSLGTPTISERIAPSISKSMAGETVASASGNIQASVTKSSPMFFTGRVFFQLSPKSRNLAAGGGGTSRATQLPGRDESLSSRTRFTCANLRPSGASLSVRRIRAMMRDVPFRFLPPGDPRGDVEAFITAA